MMKIVKYRYAVLIVSLLALALFAVLSVSGERRLSSTVSELSLPDSEECPAECEGVGVTGAVALENFHFSNTRYIKLLPGGTYKVEIERIPEYANENLIWTCDDPEVAEVSEDGTITAKKTGDTRLVATTFDRKVRRAAVVEVTALPDTILDVPYISQLFFYPNGCESVSTVMALNYAGIDITVDEFIEKYLDMKPAPTVGKDGKMWGYSPWDYFLGDPRDYTGLCCYAPCIMKALDKFVDADKYDVTELRGENLDVLCRDYIMQGTPVVIWGTMYMNDPYSPGWKWNVTGSRTGEVFEWVSPMHCLLMIGFDSDNYYFNDPTAGKMVAYRKADVEQAYAALHSQAIVIRPKLSGFEAKK